MADYKHKSESLLQKLEKHWDPRIVGIAHSKNIPVELVIKAITHTQKLQQPSCPFLSSPLLFLSLCGPSLHITILFKSLGS